MTRRWFRRHVSRAAQLTATRPSYAAGIRAAIATVVPIIAGEYFGWHTAVWMGLAGFNVSLADRGGSFRARASAMTAATFYGLLAAGAGALAGRNVWTAVAAMAIWSLATGLARVWGATATAVGVISLATFIVSVATPATNVGEAWERGGAVAAGSAFAI
ncbi:MAG: hypothetical protein JWO56_1062, partial [Acidobacteria bacterium]|nr:hypothetical protein [Acidobacteriota bacterium]